MPEFNNNEDIYHQQDGLEMLDGDAELLRDIALLFLADTPARHGQLLAALAAHDCEEIRKIAHSLKGSLGAIGALRVLQTAQGLESAAKSADWNNIPTWVDCFSQEYALLSRELAKVFGS